MGLIIIKHKLFIMFNNLFFTGWLVLIIGLFSLCIVRDNLIKIMLVIEVCFLGCLLIVLSNINLGYNFENFALALCIIIIAGVESSLLIILNIFYFKISGSVDNKVFLLK